MRLASIAFVTAALTLGQQVTFDTYTTTAEPIGDIARGPDDAMWITDLEIDRLHRIDRNGSVTAIQLNYEAATRSICAGPDGAMWFTTTASRLGRMTMNRDFSTFGIATRGESIAVGPDGAIWFTYRFSNQIGRMSMANVRTDFNLPGNSVGSAITAGPDNAMWITTSNGIVRFPVDGGTPALVAHNWRQDVSPSIALGPDGALWFTDFDRIVRMTTSGAKTFHSVPTAPAIDITAGPDGAMWYTIGVIESASFRAARRSTLGRSGLGRITTAGIITEQVIEGPSFASPRVAAGAGNTVWFTRDFDVVRATLSAPVVLSANPTSLSFSARVGAPAPTSQTVTVSSTSSGGLVLSSTTDPWLQVTPTSASTPGVFTVSVDHSNLAAGTYSGKVSFSGGASLDVPVSLTVLPRLTANPTSLTFTYRPGGALPSPQNVTASAAGSSVLVQAYAATEGEFSWITVQPSSGTTPAVFAVNVDPLGFSPGQYSGTVIIESDSESGETIEVPVTLIVQTPAGPGATPASVSFVSASGAVPPGQDVTISRPGGQRLIMAANSSNEWLQIAVGDGSFGTRLSVPPGTSNVVVRTRVDPARLGSLAPGTYPGSIDVATNSESGAVLSVPVTLEVRSQDLTITGACPANVVPGEVSEFPVSISGGTGTYTVTLTNSGNVVLTTRTALAGASPVAMRFTGAVGPNVGETFTITVRDSNGATARFQCTVRGVVREPIIPPVVLPATGNCPTGTLTVGTPFGFDLNVSGGTGVFDFDLAGSSPPGVFIVGRRMTGTPTEAGEYSWILRASSGGRSAETSCRIRVQPGELKITTSCPANARPGTWYSSPILASGGIGGGNYQISVTGLPAGLTATKGGIGGTATAVPGTYPIEIQVRSGEQTVTQRCPLVIAEPDGGAPRPRGTVSCPGPVPSGSPLSFTVGASGGAGSSYQFAVNGPEWLRIATSGAAATVSGTAGAPGSYPVSVTISDANGSSTVQCSLVVTEPLLSITGAACPAPVEAGAPLDIPLAVSGGQGPFTWQLTGGGAGLALSASAGSQVRLTGAPQRAGEYPFTVSVSDATGARRDFSCTLRVTVRPLSMSGQACPAGPVARPAGVAVSLAAVGGTGEYSWRLTGPSFLSLSAATGAAVRLSGVPTGPGDYAYTVELTDSSGAAAAPATCPFTVLPVSAPPVQFTGLSANIGASESGELSVQLTSPSPVPLTATVTLAFVADVALAGVSDNPLVQFTGGRGRSITVTIPAGQTSVPLGVRVSLSNIAGIVRLTLSSLLDVNRNVLDGPSPTAELRIARQAPLIDNITFTGAGIVIRGISNTLDMQSVNLEFSGPEVEGQRTFAFNDEVRTYFRQFFQSRLAAGGAAFEVRFPITLQGPTEGVTVVVTLRNSAGEVRSQAIGFTR